MPVQTSTAPRHQNKERNATVKKNDERIKQVRDRVDVACKAILKGLENKDPAKLKELLTFYGANGKAQRWSMNNLMAIFVQKPNIVMPVSVREAKEDYGHTIKAGSKMASIFVPVCAGSPAIWDAKKKIFEFDAFLKKHGFSKEFVQQSAVEFKEWCADQDLDPEDSLYQVRDFCLEKYPQEMLIDGFAKGFEEGVREAVAKTGAFLDVKSIQEGQRVGWKLVPCVLDLGRDTVGPELKQSVGEENEKSERVWTAMVQYANLIGLEVGFQPSLFAGGTAQEGRIDVSERLSRNAQCVTAFHELAHHVLGDVKDQKNSPDKRVPKEIREMRAEATAYITALSLDMPSDWSCTYMQNWGATPKELKVHLTEIRTASKQIIEGVKEQLELNEKVGERPVTNGEELVSSFEGLEISDIGDDEELVYSVTGSEVRDIAELLPVLHANPSATVRVSVFDNRSNSTRLERNVSAHDLQQKVLSDMRDYMRSRGAEGFIFLADDGQIAMAPRIEDVPDGIDPLLIQDESVKL